MSLFHFSLFTFHWQQWTNSLALGSEQLSNIEVQKMMTKIYLTIWHKNKTFLRKKCLFLKVCSSLVVVWLYKLWFADSTLLEIHYMHNSQRRIPRSGLAHKKIKSECNNWKSFYLAVKEHSSNIAVKGIEIYCNYLLSNW